jgi:hypothetical protein
MDQETSIDAQPPPQNYLLQDARRRPTFPEMPKQPAREIISKTPHQRTGEIDIPWLMPYPNQFQLANEPLAILTFAMCHDVSAIASQGEKVSFKFDGKAKSHYPDLWIRQDGKALLVEAKSAKDLMRPKNLEKYSAIGRDLHEQKKPYKFITDSQLQVEPRNQNVTRLARFLSVEPTPMAVEFARTNLATGKKSIRDLAAIDPKVFSIADAYTLVARRTITFDWGLPFGPDSEVSLPNQPFKGLMSNDVFFSGGYDDLLAELAMGRQPTDQQRMAAEANRRRKIHTSSPFDCVGGFPVEKVGRRFAKTDRSTSDSGPRATSNPDPSIEAASTSAGEC